MDIQSDLGGKGSCLRNNVSDAKLRGRQKRLNQVAESNSKPAKSCPKQFVCPLWLNQGDPHDCLSLIDYPKLPISIAKDSGGDTSAIKEHRRFLIGEKTMKKPIFDQISYRDHVILCLQLWSDLKSKSELSLSPVTASRWFVNS